MFKKFIYIVVITVLFFTAASFFLPRYVHVERHIEIARPAATVYTVLNSYRSFLAWSPWAERDPGARYELSGPDAGPGARLSWSGDPRLVGSGWQEIVQSEPYSLIRMALAFDQQGRSETYFRIEESTGGVRLTWGFETDLLDGQGILGGILARYFGLFFDHWIGRDYEAGLQRLKRFVEDMPAADFSGLDVQRVLAAPMDVLSFPIPPGSGLDGLSTAFREISAFMATHGILRQGLPMTISRPLAEGRWGSEAAIPIELPANPPPPEGAIRYDRSPAGEAVRAIHVGPSGELADTYDGLSAWLSAHGLSEGAVSWERYVSDPRATDAGQQVTEVYVLLGEKP